MNEKIVGLLVFLNVSNLSFLVAESFGCVVPAQLLDEGVGIARNVTRELDLFDALEDAIVRLHGV